MNSIAAAVSAVIIFYVGYVFYAQRIVRIFKPDKNKKTPAFAKYDGVDFVPAKHWSILFGHHFSSIAGAAPVIGPVLALSIWGWAPVFLWIVLGAVFIGGVHDYCSLMISVRHSGRSIADFTKVSVSKSAKVIFLLFAWISLILIISVFANLCARTLALTPSIVLPSIGLIPLAIGVGLLLYAKRFIGKHNQAVITIIGLGGFVLLMILGRRFPFAINTSNPVHFWAVILLIYSYIASILPVNILLQPRDYLSSFLLFAGILFGYAGIIFRGADLKFPAFISFSANTTDMLWPVLFVTVACGAISGFHSLVASGTTSKQLTNEVHGKRIGYGAMIAEGLLAVLALLVVSSVYSDIGSLRQVVDTGGGPVKAFGIAYGEITKGLLGNYGSVFAILALNAFILTTLDTATRIARYLTQELFRVKNRYIATLVVVALSGWLGLSGEWNSIWPVFGAANQLIAAFALIVITSWLLSAKKPVLYTIVPSIFMLITAIAALFLKIVEYGRAGSELLVFICVVLMFMAFVIVYEAGYVGLKSYIKNRLG